MSDDFDPTLLDNSSEPSFTSNVINFPEKDFVYKGKIDPQGVLDGITQNDLETIIVLGWTKEGDEYFASNTPNGMEVVWLMERLKLKILESVD
jgi:hypothetical protein